MTGVRLQSHEALGFSFVVVGAGGHGDARLRTRSADATPKHHGHMLGRIETEQQQQQQQQRPYAAFLSIMRDRTSNVVDRSRMCIDQVIGYLRVRFTGFYCCR